MIVPVPDAMSNLASGLPAFLHAWEWSDSASHLATMQACMPGAPATCQLCKHAYRGAPQQCCQASSVTLLLPPTIHLTLPPLPMSQ